jgi:hypothetical protein
VLITQFAPLGQLMLLRRPGYELSHTREKKLENAVVAKTPAGFLMRRRRWREQNWIRQIIILLFRQRSLSAVLVVKDRWIGSES